MENKLYRREEVYAPEAIAELSEHYAAILRLLGEEVPLAERLHWITSCGAAALGIGESMGSLEPGRRPGLVLLRGFDPVAMRLLPGSETIRLV